MSLVLRAHPQGVCVAGYGQSGGNEILQLLPPPTLQVKETQVGVAAQVAPELSVFFGTVSSETGLGFRSCYLVSVALTRAWPGFEQLWSKGKARKSPSYCPVEVAQVGVPVTQSCGSAGSLYHERFISRCVNESVSWGNRTDEDTKANEEGTC